MNDAAHLAALIAAGNAMHAALNNIPCRCQHNVPYAGCKVERRVTVPCAAHVSMDLWEDALLKAMASADVKP